MTLTIPHYTREILLNWENVTRYNKGMRSEAEIKLLMIRQKLTDAMRVVSDQKVVDMDLYRRLAVKLEVVRELLIECRKQALFNKPPMRRIK